MPNNKADGKLMGGRIRERRIRKRGLDLERVIFVFGGEGETRRGKREGGKNSLGVFTSG
jgi:hypothetical protein